VSNAVVALTETTFAEEIGASALPSVVEFWAEWCPPCKVIAPILDAIALENADRFQVYKIDADEHPELARRHDVISVPTVLVFKDGQLRRRMIGARSRDRLLGEILESIATD
jgi:thioredoxin 1